MTRVDIKDTKDPVIVSKQDYEADKARGYTVLEFSPAGELVFQNPRNPSKKFVKEVPAVLMFRCMTCKFDVIDGKYKDTQGGAPRSGMDLIKEHLFRRDHPWPYTPFENPYGNIEDATIEGVDDYTKEIEAWQA